MPPNQFYIQPASFDSKPILSGIGNLVAGARKAKQNQQMDRELADVMATNDPDQIADFMLKNPGVRDRVESSVGFKNKATRNNYSEFLTGFLANPTRDNFVRMADARSKFVRSHGGDSSGIDKAIALYDEDPAAAVKKAETALALFDPAKSKSYQINKMAGADNFQEAGKEIRKETRGEIRKQLGSIYKEVNVVRTNYEKLQNLAAEIKKGNRQAVPQALVALVKLGDPGSIVSTNEMMGALNGKTPVAAVFDLLTKKGVDSELAESIAGKIDPLNPNNIGIDFLLDTGRAIVSAFIPTIQDRFASADELADENLTPAGKKSLFSKRLRSSVSTLSDLIPEAQGAKQDLSAIGTIEELMALREKKLKELKSSGGN